MARYGRHPLALYGLAQLWYHSPESPNWMQETERYLKESLDADPANEWARMAQSLLLFEAGRFAEALVSASKVDRSRFVSNRLWHWRLLKLDEVMLACRSRLGEPVSEGEWRDLINRYREQTTADDGPVAFPREAIEAARECGATWVENELRLAVALPPTRPDRGSCSM